MKFRSRYIFSFSLVTIFTLSLFYALRKPQPICVDDCECLDQYRTPTAIVSLIRAGFCDPGNNKSDFLVYYALGSDNYCITRLDINTLGLFSGHIRPQTHTNGTVRIGFNEWEWRIVNGKLITCANGLVIKDSWIEPRGANFSAWSTIDKILGTGTKSNRPIGPAGEK
jgi:hypothetical protein